MDHRLHASGVRPVASHSETLEPGRVGKLLVAMQKLVAEAIAAGTDTVNPGALEEQIQPY